MRKLIIILFIFIAPEKECITLELNTDSFYFENASNFIIAPDGTR